MLRLSDILRSSAPLSLSLSRSFSAAQQLLLLRLESRHRSSSRAYHAGPRLSTRHCAAAGAEAPPGQKAGSPWSSPPPSPPPPAASSGASSGCCAVKRPVAKPAWYHARSRLARSLLDLRAPAARIPAQREGAGRGWARACAQRSWRRTDTGLHPAPRTHLPPLIARTERRLKAWGLQALVAVH